MLNVRYIFILGLFLVSAIIFGAYFSRYSNLFRFELTYRSLEDQCYDKCPHSLKCAGQDNPQRCFAFCKEICSLNPLDIPISYSDNYYMGAFQGTS